jgi:outer membrane protein
MKPLQRHLGSLAWLVMSCALSAAEPWTLERAIDHALIRNPDVRIAQHRIAAAQAGLQQANAAFWPRVQFESSYTRTDNPMRVFGSILNQRAYPYPPATPLDFNNVPDIDNLNVKGMVTMPIYSGGRNTASREAARAGAEAAKFEEEATRLALGFEVARAFHTVLKTREFIRAAETAVVSINTNLGIANLRLENGTLLKTDVLDIKVHLARAREDLVRARNANALATRALRNLLGLEDEWFEIAESAPAAAAPATIDFTQRPELIAAAERERAAEQQARGARAGHLPRVSAFGSLDYDHGWKYDEGGGSYTAGALVQWDIWDGNLTRARTREARANLESAREESRKLRLALHLEVEQARLEFQAAQERLVVTREAVDHASESAALTRARFEGGAALASQLLDAETALVAARVRRAEAEADKHIALAALRRAVGLPQMSKHAAPQ